MGKIGVFLQVFLHFLHIFKNQRVAAPSCDALHLGMMALTNQDDAASLVLCLLCKLSDALDMRAHGAHDLCPALSQRIKRRSRLAVGADEHGLPRLCLVGRRDEAHAKVFDLAHDARVVYDAAEHRAAACFCRFARKVDRALHAIAEARGLS